MRLLLDEMISPRVAQTLRASGHDVIAVAEDATLRAMPDDAVLAAAAANRRVVVTRNVSDFARLHQQWHTEGKRHHGIVMVTPQAFPQDRSFVGALTTSLTRSEELLNRASEGEAVYLHRLVR